MNIKKVTVTAFLSIVLVLQFCSSYGQVSDSENPMQGGLSDASIETTALVKKIIHLRDLERRYQDAEFLIDELIAKDDVYGFYLKGMHYVLGLTGVANGKPQQPTPEEIGKGFSYLEKAMRLGSNEAKFFLANEELRQRNLPEGLKLLNELRDKGFARAHGFLAFFYGTGLGDPALIDKKKMISNIRSGILLKDIFSLQSVFSLSPPDLAKLFPFESYENISDLVPLMEAALAHEPKLKYWFNPAPQQIPIFLRQYFIGQSPLGQRAQKIDREKALKYAIASARAGDAPAFAFLGQAGDEPIANYPLLNAALRVNEWSYRKLSPDQLAQIKSQMDSLVQKYSCDPTRKGKSDARNCLVDGVYGLLNHLDTELALQILFSLALDLDNSSAHGLLGYLYLGGRYLDKDSDKAIHHLKVAASAEDKDAAYNLYYAHKALPEIKMGDERASTYWLKKAVSFGHPSAPKVLQKHFLDKGQIDAGRLFFSKESRLQPKNKSLLQSSVMFRLASNSVSERQQAFDDMLAGLDDKEFDDFVVGIVIKAVDEEEIDLGSIRMTPPKLNEETFRNEIQKRVDRHDLAKFTAGIFSLVGIQGFPRDEALAKQYLSEVKDLVEAAEFDLAYLSFTQSLANSSRPVGCALARSKTDVYPVTAYLMAASTCGESQQEEYMKEAASNGHKQMALALAAHYVEVEEYSNASKFLNLASGSSCAPSVKPVERGFVDCNISLTKLDAVRRQLSEARRIKADADKRAREERLARQREARNSQLAIKNARHRQMQEAAIARKKEEKKAKRREFFGKLAGGLLKFTGQVLEAAVVGAITYKIADELDLDPRQTYYEPPRRNRQQGSQNLPSPRKYIIGNQSRPAQNYAPSCRCECVDGRKVSLCTSAVAVPAICAGYCPAAPKMYHPPSVAAPPPGTISCTNKSVYNEATVSYESRTVCE